MLDLKRHLFKSLEIKIGKLFSSFPVSPNQYTLLSIFFALISSYFILKQKLDLAILFFLIAGFLDFIDGAVARYKALATKVGAYLDTIADRYVEGILLFSLLFLPLPAMWLPAFGWIFLILFGSFLTTYAKATAREKELVSQELKGGILSRGERIILLLLSLFLGIIDPSFALMTELLILIAFLSNFTALERIYSTLKSAKF